jgi:hypothetical protein
MGQAKQRKEEIRNLKSNNAVVVMPLSDDALYGNGTAGDYIRKNGIKNAIIAGEAWGSVIGKCKLNITITTNMKEEHARASIEQWWLMDANKGFKKVAIWLPLNDIKEMTVSGLDKLDGGLQGVITGQILDMCGVSPEVGAAVKAEMAKGGEFAQAMKNAGLEKWMA